MTAYDCRSSQPASNGGPLSFPVVTDIDIPELRTHVDRELAAVVGRATPAQFRADQSFGIRQFLGWHRLRYGEDLPFEDIPQRLARFIVDRSVAGTPAGEPAQDGTERAMVAAGLLRETGAFTVGTLRRRIAVLSRVYRTNDPEALREHPAIQAALRTATLAERRSKARRPSSGCPLPEGERLRLLATCDASSAGLRDRALLSAWFATGASLVALLRLDQGALLAAIRNCPSPAHRTAAAQAVSSWCDHAKLPAGPVFRRIWGSDRIGAPMSEDAAHRMLRRRLTLAAASPASLEEQA